MKKIFFLLIATFLFAQNIETYLYSVNVDYREYDSNGAYLDGESNSFGDLNGIGVKYHNAYANIKYYIKGEYAYGSTTYDGQTWSGTPLTLKKNNAWILNIQAALAPRRSPLYIGVGYRGWDRGYSDYPGDYDEYYYWPYMSFGYSYVFKINKLFVLPEIEYQYAINPKLDAKIGSGATLDLGTTTGYKAELKFGYVYNNLLITCFYRYQFWHISPSQPAVITLNGSQVTIYEPESYTRNQYLGIGVLFKF
ncbi:hypothetical protein C3L23_05230 [Nautilia sp. PV-1]|uniref:hypothetical protein n=1 Tax=Nautilia sp. PV-1 TaxID=2579250 RepID=UPI000FDA6634|nr:hypothetical protein [Nautilia sp. PV-1]AZV46695.1 hypothetical protein C3L23_05230 [Nautilia sp. PV-1]